MFIVSVYSKSVIVTHCVHYITALFDMSRETNTGVALYSRKVMITPHAPVLPKWLRFFKGVVDSEDVPLNLSREFMQDHQLIKYVPVCLCVSVCTMF